MTSRDTSVAPAPASAGGAGGLRALPRLVTFVLVLNVATGIVAARLGVSDLGRTDLWSVLQSFLVVGAAAATMWRRVRTAVVTTTAAAVAVFALGPTGSEVFLLVIVGIMAGQRGTWRRIGLAVVGFVAYGIGFGLTQQDRHPGWGPAAFGYVMVSGGIGLLVGVVAHAFLLARDRRRTEVAAIAAENDQIRVVERGRLADDLQVVLTEALSSMSQEIAVGLAPVTPSDPGTLRCTLDRVDQHSRSVLARLRELLEVLRREGDGRDRSPARDTGRRSVVDGLVDLVTVQNIRRTAAALAGVAGLLVAVARLGSGAGPDATSWLALAGGAVCVAALWRPGAAAFGAALVLVASIALQTGVAASLVPVALLSLLGAFVAAARRFWCFVLALLGYVFLLGLTDRSNTFDDIVLTSYVAVLATTVGLVARHLTDARRASQQDRSWLLRERGRMEVEERSAIARELHDVVAHQLSSTTMLIMATSETQEPAALAGTLARVRRTTEAAQHELATLLLALRGPSTARERQPTPLVTPLVTMRALRQRLEENGYHLEEAVDAAVETLDPTTQRTLSRIMQEAATNILRYTPAGATCRFEIEVAADQHTGAATEVGLRISSPLGSSARRSDLSLGWGLRGIRERVDLTHGRFRAGPDHGRWVVVVNVPLTETTAEPTSGGDDRLAALPG